VTSPASTGPAGAHFEGKVGAHYLLSMLVGAPPRGLPGTTIDRVELQRAQEGMYLDDVIVRAHDERGIPAVLEIQVKRTIAFTPTDKVFRSVVDQIVLTSRKPEFWNSKFELAIATARTSRKIDGAYQDVLTWARQLGDATTFKERINRHGSSNEDMRTFVTTFTSHLRDAGAPYDNESVWQLLRRLQILIYDFTTQGSASEELAKERAARALQSDDVMRAGDLWSNLTDLALEVAVAGGDRDRSRLVNDLGKYSFRLAGLPVDMKSQAALAEASRYALQDIADRVCGVMLTRQVHVAAVHAALETGRYVEIRGDAGVGKSGILRHFAEQISTESQILFLSPGRTQPRGWLELRSALGFSRSCRDLLYDLAGNGGAVLFIDNLDFFPQDERLTVIDIIREAVTVPGFSIVATARREFGRLEPSWLPKELIASLGASEPVFVNELSEDEVEELRDGAPRLGWLLTDNHPARSVTRNLFRLSRLASLRADEPVPLSEAEMALRWWSVADGAKDSLYLDRSRLLRSLADQVLARSERLDTSSNPSAAVYALIQSETLRDFGNDRVAFRHDVLREWAVANLLYADGTALDCLRLNHPAPPDLARAVELAGRMTIERASDTEEWLSMLQRLSKNGIHGSWRRAVLLALVRSELGTDLLIRAADSLIENGAQLLRELIRTVTAVDAEPASRRFVLLGFDPAKIPPGINVPSGPSWSRLIRWLLIVSPSLPVAVIPDVVKLYGDWSLGMMGVDPLTPLLLRQLYRWLMDIELPGESPSVPFREGLSHEQIPELASEIRTGFLLFCNRTPELASQYLKSFENREIREEAMVSILKFSSALAQAAPAELVDFTVEALIPKPKKRNRSHQPDVFEKAFGFVDLKFIPASPAQGPFLELLNHAPAEGLRLIRRLIDHAVSVYSRGRDHGEDAVTIVFGDREHTFPWTMSYVWSRQDGDAPYIVTSALMALEIWANRRIEAGEAIGTALIDILGAPGAPTAYLLVAVDLLISHWPKSTDAAVPFLACPELLCMDRNRFSFDNHEEFPDLFGLKGLQKEPIGAASVADLKKLPSRAHMLDELLSGYLDPQLTEAHDTLENLLIKAAARIEAPSEHSTMLDPRLTVRYALNVLNPKNWREAAVELKDGTFGTVRQYASPPDEALHFQRLQNESKDRRINAQMAKILGDLLEQPGRCTPEFIVAATAWAQRKSDLWDKKQTDENEMDENWIPKQAIFTTALVLARDGTPELRAQHYAWIREIFSHALSTKDDDVHRVRGGLKFNPAAIAFLGLIHLMKDHRSTEDIRALLDVAGRDNPAAARGMAAGAYDLANIDERLPCAVLRTAFQSRNQPHHDWNQQDKDFAIELASHRQRVQSHIDSELAWLEKDHPQPAWPEFVPRLPYVSYPSRRRASKDQPEPPITDESEPRMRTDSQGAGIWLESALELFDVTARPWLRTIISTYKEWTKVANGLGVDLDERVESAPTEWNESYFKLLPACLVDLSVEEVAETISDHFSSLPEESFFDMMTLFQRNVDLIYFNGTSLPEEAAVKTRSILAKRMMSTNGWSRLRSVRKDSTEMHIAPAIAVLFFVNHGHFQASQSYLLEKGVDRLTPFLSTLETLAKDNPSPFVVNMSLILLEVSPRPSHLSFLVSCASGWMAEYADNSTFWVEYGIGRRWCSLVDTILQLDPKEVTADSVRRIDIDHLLAALVRVGVSEAKRLEEALQSLT
jgi:hypothetical protein